MSKTDDNSAAFCSNNIHDKEASFQDNPSFKLFGTELFNYNMCIPGKDIF